MDLGIDEERKPVTVLLGERDGRRAPRPLNVSVVYLLTLPMLFGISRFTTSSTGKLHRKDD